MAEQPADLRDRATDARDAATGVRDRLLSALSVDPPVPISLTPAEVIQLAACVQSLAQTVAEMAVLLSDTASLASLVSRSPWRSSDTDAQPQQVRGSVYGQSTLKGWDHDHG